MKRSDLKAGELYAVRGNYWQPYMLLSTEVHERLVPTRGAVSYKAAPDEKPRRNSVAWGDRRDYGYLAIGGTPEALATVNLAAHLAAIVDGTLDPDEVPDSIGLKLVTSLAQIEGLYGEVLAKRDAEQAQYKAGRAREANIWNEVRAVFNPLLGDDFMPIVEGAAPQHLTLTLEQAKLIADALAAKET